MTNTTAISLAKCRLDRLLLLAGGEDDDEKDDDKYRDIKNAIEVATKRGAQIDRKLVERKAESIQQLLEDNVNAKLEVQFRGNNLLTLKHTVPIKVPVILEPVPVFERGVRTGEMRTTYNLEDLMDNVITKAIRNARNHNTDIDIKLIYQKRRLLLRMMNRHDSDGVELQFRKDDEVMLRLKKKYIHEQEIDITKPILGMLSLKNHGDTIQEGYSFQTYSLEHFLGESVDASNDDGDGSGECVLYRDIRNNVYHEGYRPPQWVADHCDQLIEQYGGKAYVLYIGDNHSKTTIESLARNREPVNIGMKRRYDKDKLNDICDYSEGEYGTITSKEPPAMAVVCQTPIVPPIHGKGEDIKVDDKGALNPSHARVITVVNLIGMAFDNKKQPDLERFGENPSKLKGPLSDAYVRMWRLAFESVVHTGRSVLCASPVGDNAFRPKNFSREEFQKLCYVHAIAEARNTDDRYKNIRVEWMPFFPLYRVPHSLIDKGAGTVNGDYVNLYLNQSDLNERVFVNAWDPWSVPGNGNDGDNSIDGWWGRSTAISLLGWPLVNPHITYVNVNNPS